MGPVVILLACGGGIEGKRNDPGRDRFRHTVIGNALSVFVGIKGAGVDVDVIRISDRDFLNRGFVRVWRARRR